MAARTTLYLSDESQAKLQALFAWAKSDPRAWNGLTGTTAPANPNQLFARLIELGHAMMARSLGISALAEAAPDWIMHSDVLTDEALIPRTDAEHYQFLLAQEAQRRGMTLQAVRDEWQRLRGRDAKLPDLEDDPLWGMVGIGHGGRADVSEDHDRYLTDARLARLSSAS